MQQPETYELKIYDHISIIDPMKYGAPDIPKIDPKNWFVTSGDALIKSQVLEKHIATTKHEVKKRYLSNKTNGLSRLLKDLDQAHRQAKKLVLLMKTIKGPNIFLELEWVNHDLILTPKNPRIKDAE